MDNQVLVNLEDVSFSFGERPVHRNLSLQVPRGSIVAVMGPSGCGKSTLLNFIGGRLRPDQGAVWLDGQQVNRASRAELYQLRMKMGMMFQHNALLNAGSVLRRNAAPGGAGARDRAGPDAGNV